MSDTDFFFFFFCNNFFLILELYFDIDINNFQQQKYWGGKEGFDFTRNIYVQII